jgi:phenylacetate-CoA ligase
MLEVDRRTTWPDDRMALPESFFHLRSLPGTVWPALPMPEVSLIWSAYRELDRTQWLRPADLQNLQLRQLNLLLRHCFQYVPYYRKLLSDCGFPAREITSLDEFRKIPVLTRELYQANFKDLQARKLPDGIIAGTKGLFTSGTNGVPIHVLKTNRDDLWWSALCLRDCEWCRLDPRKRMANIRLLAYAKEDLPRALAGGAAPSWRKFFARLFENGPAFGMDVRQDPRRQLEWLRAVRANYLVSMPTNLEFLANLVRDSGEPLGGLEIIQAVGESLSDAARQRIESGFGVSVKNLYSTTECGYIASSCPSGHGLHVHAESVLAEVLDDNDQPCAPGQTGRLVFTALHSFFVPFVRYEILDDVTLAPGPCPCGRGLPLWTQVEGRQHATLHLSDGGRKSSIGITLGLRQVGGVHQFQIVQRAVEHVVLRVVPDKSWTPQHAERMRECVQFEFGSPIRVDVEEHKFLERPAGGKLKIVVVELDKPQN